MADITMCEGAGCSRKDACYRHTAPQNEYRQSWFTTVPLEIIKLPNPVDGEIEYVEQCEHFWSNEGYTK